MRWINYSTVLFLNCKNMKLKKFFFNLWFVNRHFLVVNLFWGAGMAAWWECSALIHAAWVRCRRGAIAGLSLSWFSSLLRRFFSGLSGFPSFANTNIPTTGQRTCLKTSWAWCDLTASKYFNLFVCLFVHSLSYVPCCSCSIRWCPSSPNTWHNPKEIWLTWSLFNVLNDRSTMKRPSSKGLPHRISVIYFTLLLLCVFGNVHRSWSVRNNVERSLNSWRQSFPKRVSREEPTCFAHTENEYNGILA